MSISKLISGFNGILIKISISLQNFTSEFIQKINMPNIANTLKE